MMFYMMIVLAVGAASVRGGGQDDELNGQCNGTKPTTVNCEDPQDMFFFDPESRTCQEANGCATSDNIFISEQHCRYTCARPSVPDESCKGAKPTTVNCNNPEEVSFFDPETKRCERIAGCRSSNNYFPSREECHFVCGGDMA
ncbi:uncharacterized protein LOC135401087 [Ornithodoros turicata]|uniref:uncharacterized protein LOC135401087 n=1 Tax=Ornithodoros turicata TaxID=34597 RepID=UPI003138A1B4